MDDLEPDQKPLRLPVTGLVQGKPLYADDQEKGGLLSEAKV
jgi:hypothetical protein